jgi:hypothetical protein
MLGFIISLHQPRSKPIHLTAFGLVGCDVLQADVSIDCENTNSFRTASHPLEVVPFPFATCSKLSFEPDGSAEKDPVVRR